ncbi:Crp/Fnr family transcriptional regulator [Chroococcidiopsis sp. FACHB-1243]|uniref:Crp/Fnr family transcriptional regulator n=1 Tax=Chroococcidiopsis sp. [FACHB-1243] TaxID=2692781 RepID=UPI0017872C26|nr:Crp/Fnr family transcriptional regulator [Chroococcidiopsis sp. [FACHB-1243]]MBD2308679.1 Crp/Fnr family transcriptional regulator [Chroococcidiopsis sp. [FACHB-1243]]
MSYVQPIYRNRDDVTISPAISTRIQFQRRDRLPENQEVLWQIESGIARSITWSQEGELVCLGYWGAGDVVGHALSRVQPYEIHCLTNVEVSRWNRNQWAQLTDAIVHHQQQTEELLSIIHINPISQKLWQLLVWLSQKFGRNVDNGQTLELPLTHQQLAQTLGTSRVTVTRVLQQLEVEGKIRRQRRRLVVTTT